MPRRNLQNEEGPLENVVLRPESRVPLLLVPGAGCNFICRAYSFPGSLRAVAFQHFLGNRTGTLFLVGCL